LYQGTYPVVFFYNWFNYFLWSDYITTINKEIIFEVIHAWQNIFNTSVNAYIECINHYKNIKLK
jgi:hypothetical protein